MDDTSREERNHQLVMPGQAKAASRAIGDGPANDVCGGPIVLEEVEIRGGEILQRMAEIADHGDGF